MNTEHIAGTFKLKIEFTEEYPNKAPVVKFKSTVLHPNSTFTDCFLMKKSRYMRCKNSAVLS